MRLAFMSAAHVHADAYVSCLQSMSDVEIIGIADHDSVRGKAFASRYGLSFSRAMIRCSIKNQTAYS